jgi:hypothetical protein
MVVAHLQGLLSRNHRFGRRSGATEEIILESLSAQMLALSMESGIASDLALIPVMTEKGIQNTLENVGARRGRVAELRLLDVYKVAEQLSGTLKLANPQKEMSLFQLYQLAEKSGIFEVFAAHHKPENTKPLL